MNKKKIKLEPVFDKFIILIDGIALSTGSIIVPDAIKEKYSRAIAVGKILKVGPGHFDPPTKGYFPLIVKEGDYVMVGRYSPYYLEFTEDYVVEGIPKERYKDLAVVKEQDIIVIVHEEDYIEPITNS